MSPCWDFGPPILTSSSKADRHLCGCTNCSQVSFYSRRICGLNVLCKAAAHNYSRKSTMTSAFVTSLPTRLFSHRIHITKPLSSRLPSKRLELQRRSARPPLASYAVHDDSDSGVERAVAAQPASAGPNMGPDPEFIEHCETCDDTGFVPCSTCNAQGHIRNPRSTNVFYCPDCVGHKKLRCPACGGKCYMCE